MINTLAPGRWVPQELSDAFRAPQSRGSRRVPSRGQAGLCFLGTVPSIHKLTHRAPGPCLLPLSSLGPQPPNGDLVCLEEYVHPPEQQYSNTHPWLPSYTETRRSNPLPSSSSPLFQGQDKRALSLGTVQQRQTLGIRTLSS